MDYEQKYKELIELVAKGLDPIAVAVNELTNRLSEVASAEAEGEAPQTKTTPILDNYLERSNLLNSEIQKEFLQQVKSLREERERKRERPTG